MVFLHDPRIPSEVRPPQTTGRTIIQKEKGKEIMENPQSPIRKTSPPQTTRRTIIQKEKGKEIMENPQSLITKNLQSGNIILNHDFSDEVDPTQHWKVTSTGGGRVVPHMSKYLEDILPYSGVNYLVIARRTTKYDGLEQDITQRFLINVRSTYKFSAWVRLYGGSLGDEEEGEVLARLKLDYGNERPDPDWPVLASEYMSKADGWKNLVGSYKFEGSKSEKPKGVLFFFEGPEAGVDLLINSVVMSPSVV